MINGIFAMAEIAIISSRKSKLQQLADEGNKNAEKALDLAKSPNEFFSTVQIGITLFGILAGAFGGSSITENLSKQISQMKILQPYSHAIALTFIVTSITYLSLILGELVPKRIALYYPERIARIIARPMKILSSLAHPLVWLLSTSTAWVLRILQIKESNGSSVTEEEVNLLLKQGTQEGVFETAEKDIVERSLGLSDKKVNSFMISRKDIVWLDFDSSLKKIQNIITKKPHSHYPVCRSSLDKVIGIVRTENLLIDYLEEKKIDLKKLIDKPLFIPESLDALRILELFKSSRVHMALVVDEYGNIQGIITLTDILESIVGDIPASNNRDEKEITNRGNNTYLVDGMILLDKFKHYFQIKKLPDEKKGLFHTIGGFVTNRIGRIPVTGDVFELDNLRFEIVDMDGNRVDKILIIRKKFKNKSNI